MTLGLEYFFNSSNFFTGIKFLDLNNFSIVYVKYIKKYKKFV